MKIELNGETLQDAINIASGLLFPLEGFMGEKDYNEVVLNMKLASGAIWTIPVTLDVEKESFELITAGQLVELTHEGKVIGTIEVSSKYTVDYKNDLRQVFKTDDDSHPGVKKEKGRSPLRIGGKVKITEASLLDSSLSPKKVKKDFERLGYKTVVGFQTRNPVHRAHEHLHRVALDTCDAVFINPLVGWKKKGDFSEEAVVSGYRAMIENYYPDHKIYFDVLRTQMRYAGPREAVFHAIIRRNLGCTHFIIGRDHAGVGNYYGTYEAQELAKELSRNDGLGIEIMTISEPYYCNKCEHVVTKDTCKHYDTHRIEISGTIIRGKLSSGERPDSKMMRPEVSDAILKLENKMFIE